MKKICYETITGRRLDLSGLKPEEGAFLIKVLTKFRQRPPWAEFESFWLPEFQRTGLSTDSPVFRICNDLDARLGIAQGKVAPPDYRDYLLDLIEDRFGTRYRFCKETGVDPGHLSRVLAGKSDLSIALLQRLMEPLGAAVVVQPREVLDARLSPEHAQRLLEALAA
ncbi:MAG: hypothetical protein D6696_08595 [Acidobacteria bacterium]|nr:MAG: hypothetical protein D6696_08595 [Acidobacteriota bacterium]